MKEHENELAMHVR